MYFWCYILPSQCGVVGIVVYWEPENHYSNSAPIYNYTYDLIAGLQFFYLKTESLDNLKITPWIFYTHNCSSNASLTLKTQAYLETQS